MTEIPDDILKTARALAANEQFILSAVHGTSVLSEGTIIEIALAILDERERCAQVAKAEYDLMESAGLSHPEDSLSRDNCFARARSASAIERAIHQGKAALEDTER